MAGEGQEPSVADRRRALLQRAEVVRLRWGWPERLALAGLAALLIGAALPWGTDAAAVPLWLGQASSSAAVLVGTALAAVVVPARTAAAWRWDRLQAVVGLAGAVAALGTLIVRDVDGGALPLLVPGRIVVVVGGVALLGAAAGMARTAAARRRAASWSEGVRWQALAADDAAVERVLAESRAEAGATHPGWPGAALVAMGAGALALVGPWWRGFDVQGPVRSGLSPEPELDGGESAATVRSGIELLGPARSWAVAAALLLATAVVVWRGGRRGAPAVAAAGAFAVGVLATSTFHGQVERTLVPALAVGAAALGLVAAVGSSREETPWAKVAGLLLFMVPALVGVTWSAAERRAREPEADGPYRVLLGAPDGSGNVDAAAFDGSPGSDAAALTGAPVWVGDLPGAVGITDLPGGAGALALWVVSDDRVEVRRIFRDPGVSGPEDIELTGTMLTLEHRLSEVGVLRPVLPVDGRGRDADLPDGTRAAAVGPRGEVWMQASYDEGAWSPGAIYLATVGELSDPDTPLTSIEEWPEGSPLPEGFVGAMALGPERAFVVLDSGDRIVAVDGDGASETVLGGVPDEACGLNRRAAASWVDPAAQPDAPTDSALEVTAPDGDGGLWVTLPTPEPHDARFQLGKIDSDGTLRVVDHPLPGIRGIAPHPRGDAVLVVDATGRLLELPDANAEAVPLPPPPDGCATEEPIVAPPVPARALTPLAAADGPEPRGELLDTRGTRLVGAPSGDEAIPGTVLTRVAADGTEQVVADGRPGPTGRGSGAVTDGAGGAWWLEVVGAGLVDLESPFAVRAVHLLADGTVVRSAAPLEVGPSLQDFGLWADGDAAYVLGPDTISRIEGDRVHVVAEGPHVAALDGEQDRIMTTRSGAVVAQLAESQALVRLVGDRQEPLVGRPSSADPADPTTEVAPEIDPGAGPDDRPRRTLPVEVDLGLAPGEVHIDGDVVPDPAGDGLLVVQDGLLVRVALDGTITPLAQDPQLDGVLSVLDGRVILHHEGRSFTMEVPG